MGKSRRRDSKGHSQAKYSQQHQRIGTHCLKVWECVLYYQSTFLGKYLAKHHDVYEKLRLIDQDRNAFLKWLQKGGLAKTTQTLKDVTKKPWDDCWQTEKALLRQRWEEDLKKNKESNQRAEQYAEALPSAVVQEQASFNDAIDTLKNIEDARMNSRRHRIYYRDLRATSAWIHLNFKLRVQSPLWLATFRTPWDDAWYLNFVEGPHRKRKKLMRHRDFNRMYKVSKTKFFDLLSQHPAFQQYYLEYNSFHDNPDKFTTYYSHIVHQQQNGQLAIEASPEQNKKKKQPQISITQAPSTSTTVTTNNNGNITPISPNDNTPTLNNTDSMSVPTRDRKHARGPSADVHAAADEDLNTIMVNPPSKSELESELDQKEFKRKKVKLPIISDEDNPIDPKPMRKRSLHNKVQPLPDQMRTPENTRIRKDSHNRAASMSIGQMNAVAMNGGNLLKLLREPSGNEPSITQQSVLDSNGNDENREQTPEPELSMTAESFGLDVDNEENSITNPKRNDEDSVYDAADELNDEIIYDESDDKETEDDTENDIPQPTKQENDKFANLIQTRHITENSRLDDLHRLTVQTTNATSIEELYKAEKRRQRILKSAEPITPMVESGSKPSIIEPSITMTDTDKKDNDDEPVTPTTPTEENSVSMNGSYDKQTKLNGTESDEKSTTDTSNISNKVQMNGHHSGQPPTPSTSRESKSSTSSTNKRITKNKVFQPSTSPVPEDEELERKWQDVSPLKRKTKLDINLIKHQASMLNTEVPFGTVSDRMARLSISTGVELGLHDRISRVLGPGDEYDPYRTYNCSTITGLNEHGGVILICRYAMYFFFNIKVVPETGKLEEIPYDQTKRGLFTTRFVFKTKSIGPQIAVDKVKQSIYYDPKNPYRPKNAIVAGPKLDENGKDDTITHKEPKRWPFNDLREFHKRRYQLQKIAMEFYLHDGSNFLLVFTNQSDRNDFHKKLTQVDMFQKQQKDKSKAGGGKNQDRESKTNDTLKHISAVTDESRLGRAVKGIGSKLAGVTMTEYDTKKVTDRWVKGEMSNFAYLMFLNTLAGRTFNDISQYPVFPWVLKDYESAELDLKDEKIFRDLSKPMGAQTEPRAAEFRDRYETYEDPTGEVSKFHYGTHYSYGGIICYFMIRLEPFTRIALELQDGKFDHADRLFSSVAYSWKLASETGGMQDVKELIPEFFYLSNFLTNTNRFDYGTTEKGVAIDDVLLPKWSYGDPERFVRMHRNALESEYVSLHLHEWIDLIFGYKQRGDAAVEAQNVFYPWTYEDAIDLDTITDEVKKTSIISMIDNFGQTPHQLFTKPHKQKEVVKPKITVYSQPSLLQSTKLLTAASSDLPIKFLEVTPDLKTIYRGENEIVIGPEYKYTLKWGFSDRSLRVFYKGELVTVFEELVATDNGQITCVLVSDDGNVVFTGDTTSVVNVWKIKTEPRKDKRRPPHATVSLRNRLYGHTDEITCLAYSKEYRVIVSGSKDNSVIIWDLNSLQYVHRLEGHTQAIQSVAINNVTGDIIAAAGVTISAWTLNGELLAWICTGQSLITNTITSLAVATLSDWQPEDSCSVITGHRDGSLRFWALTIPNGPQEVLDCKHIYNNAKTSKKKTQNTSTINTDDDYEQHKKSEEKYFKPQLPPYQTRRMKYRSIEDIESHDVPPDDLEEETEDEVKKYGDDEDDEEDEIKQSTTTKQLRTDTTLRFKQKHNRKKHSSSVTVIHTSMYTDQHIWTASSNGEIRQWSLHRSEDHWINDNDVKECPKCRTQFGVLERRHHCRKCGQIYCHKCSNNKIELPDLGYSEPVRVCDFCWDRISSNYEKTKVAKLANALSSPSPSPNRSNDNNTSNENTPALTNSVSPKNENNSNSQLITNHDQQQLQSQINGNNNNNDIINKQDSMSQSVGVGNTVIVESQPSLESVSDSNSKSSKKRKGFKFKK